jgi:hypothetical protein
MLNLRPHYRPQIPNSLAFFAVLLLLISAAAGLHTSQNANPPGQETGIPVNAETTGNDDVNDATSTKPRGLNLGLLLFRRG